jgi:hypothetical protein
VRKLPGAPESRVDHEKTNIGRSILVELNSVGVSTTSVGEGTSALLLVPSGILGAHSCSMLAQSKMWDVERRKRKREKRERYLALNWWFRNSTQSKSWTSSCPMMPLTI